MENTRLALRPGTAIHIVTARFSKLIIFLCLLGFLSSPAQVGAASPVTVCDEASLRTALSTGGTIDFGCDGTIYLTNTLIVTTDTVLQAAGHTVTISGSNTVQVFRVNTNVNFVLRGL